MRRMSNIIDLDKHRKPKSKRKIITSLRKELDRFISGTTALKKLVDAGGKKKRLMRSDYYMLKDKVPVHVEFMEWARYFEKAERSVKQDVISKDVRVSTVFLGLDHRWGPGDPLLFETMVFGGEHNHWMNRYCTWDEAVEGHDRAVAMVKGEDGGGDAA